ncbi:site-specific integrase [Lachnospiraceae bacterium LCP19S3_B12]
MASIQRRGKKYCVVYRYQDEEGNSHQKWETFDNQKDADKRKKEVDYKIALGQFEVPKCVKVKELLDEYVKIYGHNKWGVSTYDGNMALINNYIIPTIGDVKLSDINNHFMEKYYKELLKMPAVKSTRNRKGTHTISAATINDIHKLLRSCFRQAVKWGLMEKNPAIDATVPKYKKKEREIWTAEMLMQALDACENKWLRVAFHLAFTATLRIGELLGLTWDCVEISDEAIEENRSYIIINKEVVRVSKKAVEELDEKDIILTFPSTVKNNKTVRVLKTPKTESSVRKVFIPRSVALCLKELKQEQDDLIDALGSEYHNYNLVMATTFGHPISGSYLREKMQKVIDEQGLPDVVFHSLRHTSVTYKLKLSGGDIKAVQGDSGHAQADMVTEVYGHILDEDRRKNAELIESAFYNKENLSPNMHGQEPKSKTVSVPDGVDAELLMKVLENPEMAALLTSLAKTMKV